MIGPLWAVKMPFSSINGGLRSLFGAKKSGPPPGWMVRQESAKLEKAELIAAERPCANWSWAAGVVSMVQARGARIAQEYLIDRLYGGSLCLDSVADLPGLADQISHAYTLNDGQKFRIDAHFTPGAPTQPDFLIADLRQDKPVMLIWRGRIYLLTAMEWQEYIAPTGNKMFAIQTLRLFDPAAPTPETREITFSRDTDNPDDLNGTLELDVNPK
jgi:hypothetical protein